MGANKAQKSLITIGEDSAPRNQANGNNTPSRTPPEPSLADRYEAVFRMSQAIAAYRNLDELFCGLAREVSQVIRADGIRLIQYDEVQGKVERSSEAGRFPPLDCPADETMSSWVYQHQEPLVISSDDREICFPGLMDQLKKCGIQSVCALPLSTVHRRIGGLFIGSEDPNVYTKDDVRFLSLVANQVALAIDDALNWDASRLALAEMVRRHDEFQRERDRLKLLLEVNNNVISNLELRNLLASISASVRRVMQCDAVAVHLPHSEEQLRIYALDFPESRGFMQEEALIPIKETGPGRVFRTGQPLAGSPRHTSSNPHCNAVTDEGLRFGCLLPLVSRNRVLGVLALGRRQEPPFEQDDVDFLMQVAGQVAIAIDNAFAYGQIADLRDKLAEEKLYLEDEIRSQMNFNDIVGSSPALCRVLQQVETVAPTDSAVLILGETGTGKELVARAIHNLSRRKDRSFVKLNCAAIPTGLLESELFGHEKGAFTGAITQRIGRFELANGGTAFLDEIGEIPLELQPKLLRVLQEREFERLGSTRTLRTDARLVAATNRDLAAMVEDQKFRADLFYRLNVFPVRVPSLRERSEDIPLLVRHFAQQFARRSNKAIETIPSETMNSLVRYHWPGNVRELQNVIERAVILSTGAVLRVPLSDLKKRELGASPGKSETLEEAERKHILAALRETNWVVGGPNGAAIRLGMNRSTLQFRMKKMGISRPTVQ